MPPPQPESLSGVPPEAEARAIARFNQLDGFAGLRDGLRRIAENEESWAGIPMPLDGHRLVIEPRFPRAEALSNLLVKQPEHEPEEDGYTIRNSFWSFTRKARVIVYEKEGRVRCLLDHGANTATRLLETLDCSFAWGIEQEGRAVQTLGTLLRHHTFKAYLLTGMFMETSKRSGLTYVFRKLRPTIVLDTKTAPITIRCCLCMHPIGYYEGTWAGAMTPTDDVIAHLMMMRGDEPMFWRRANQHPAWMPEAGLH